MSIKNNDIADTIKTFEITNNYSHECGELAMIIDSDEGKSITRQRLKRLFDKFIKEIKSLSAVQNSDLKAEIIKTINSEAETQWKNLWKDQESKYDFGHISGIHKRGPKFNIYQNKADLDIWNNRRSNLKENILKVKIEQKYSLDLLKKVDTSSMIHQNNISNDNRPELTLGN